MIETAREREMRRIYLDLPDEAGKQDFMELINRSAYTFGLKKLALAFDDSQSALCRKLSGSSDTHFPLYRYPEFLRVTGDMSSLLSLVGTYMAEDESEQARAMRAFRKLLPEIEKIAAVMKAED